MPISNPYLASKIALIRLSRVNALLQKISTLEQSIKNSGMQLEQANNLISIYKSNLLTLIKNRIEDAAEGAIVHALSAATEAGEKNTLLTPVIASIPVNPAAGLNIAEIAAMVLDGSNAAASLANLLDNATKLLS